ncbi:MAG: gamma-glutamylcyclotransferase [Kordiimonadaceae bacterium]|nr:gamma-glutamylcyclotransferase [Kordiimonadaceae bacterium]
MNVFFYGLFMDKVLLAKKGISPRYAEAGYVNNFALRIGERATLLPSAGARSYGVMMAISAAETEDLYADSTVADYVPEPVTVELLEGGNAEAICYNISAAKVSGTNKGYATSLLAVAHRLGFPKTYLDQIRQAGI